MTKNEAVKTFKEEFPEVLESNDRCYKQLVWSQYIDGLNRDGYITDKQYQAWDNPNFCK